MEQRGRAINPLCISHGRRHEKGGAKDELSRRFGFGIFFGDGQTSVSVVDQLLL
jgi:hypothetical protein